MTGLRGTLIAAAFPLLLITACAQTAGNHAAGASEPAASESAAASGSDDLVLRVESFGGFVPAEQNIGRIPTVSVYADGRLITQGPTTLIYPGEALPNIQEQLLTPEVVQDLVRRGAEAGVRNGADFGSPNIADAPYTRVTVGDQSVNVMALGEAQANDPRLTQAQRDARTKLSAYVKQLQSLSSAEGVAKPVRYQPETLAALARKYVAPQDASLAGPAKAWPGPALPGETLNENLGIGCVAVSGAEKDAVWKAAESATQITPWTSGGGKWSVTFRPLLPEETGCLALKGAK
ncbi:hypothetical protein ACFQS1_24430 [Paractinoplanes rhizophilus]|uniref:Uncharacterized protein n=1 Tax=Paractinoplanes rhizophilus TaxID=1416877 RepID=A0ABW2HVH0_9ACTN